MGVSRTYAEKATLNLRKVEVCVGKNPKGHNPSAEPKHRGFELLSSGLALATEIVAVAYGYTWLAWIAAVFFLGAFWEYTKADLKRRHWSIRCGALLIATAVLGTATMLAVGKMEQHLRARFVEMPTGLQFSVMPDRTIILDNTKGDDLQDFKINALGYYLNGRAVNNRQATIEKRSVFGGDVDFEHFDLSAGEKKSISPTEPRFGLLLNWNKPSDEATQTFDSMVHYLCLRFVFRKKDTGETFVHYVVLSPYSDKFDYAGSPEHSSSEGQAGGEGFPFSIARNIKADARCYYGSEFREYQP